MSQTMPGILTFLSYWRFDPFWIVVLAAVGWWYVHNVRKLEAQSPRVPHPRWKMWSFLGGLALIAITALTPLEHWGNIFLSVDFVDFLVISMIAPIFLLLGSPLTLAFRVATPAGRTRLRRLYRNRISSVITYPIFTWLAFAIVTYVWSFSRLTDIAASNGVVRDVELMSLLLVGILFYIPALCTDPVRWRMNFPLRLFYVLVESTHKSLFGGMFTSMTSVFHPAMESALPAWGPTPLNDQRAGILIFVIAGNIIFITVIGFLVARWVQYEGRRTARLDKRLAQERLVAAQRQAALEQVFRRSI